MSTQQYVEHNIGRGPQACWITWITGLTYSIGSMLIWEGGRLRWLTVRIWSGMWCFDAPISNGIVSSITDELTLCLLNPLLWQNFVRLTTGWLSNKVTLAFQMWPGRGSANAYCSARVRPKLAMWICGELMAQSPRHRFMHRVVVLCYGIEHGN